MDPAFAALHSDVAAWCDTQFGSATSAQAQALAPILAGQNVLVASPTGTGKTLTAFLPAMDRLARLRDADQLFARTYIVYVSPLRALGYDVETNVRKPMRAMGLLERPNTERATVRGGRIRETHVRTGVRTGDTPTDERRLMLSRPPHILLTTPESLALMVAMNSYRKTFSYVEMVIIDEIHALAGSKRGSQLSLVLESLEEIVRADRLIRVGLSATIEPLDRIGAFLTGAERPCTIVDARSVRDISIAIEAPFRTASAGMMQIAARAATIAENSGTTLVFTNVRSQAERLAHEMAQKTEAVEFAQELPSNERRNKRIGVHHSSLERNVRHRLEADLRAGTVRTVVCSSSLELGIDVGYIDRVVLIGGARGMTTTLQRVGRAGHRPGAIARGTILAQDRDDLIEGAATLACIRDRILEETAIPDQPLDVLSQWLVGLCAPDLRVTFEEILRIARRAYPYRNLDAQSLAACVRYLSGDGGDEGQARRIGIDSEAVYGLGREVSSAYYENVGTIPDERKILVRSKSNDIGTLEEGFVANLNVGDVFLLSGRTVRVREIRDSRVDVEPHAARPTVPQWSSHMKGVPRELACAIANLRREINDIFAGDMPLEEAIAVAVVRLRTTYAMEPREALLVAEYVRQQRSVSVVPEDSTPVIELYEMDGRPVAVMHTCIGRRANEALARVVGARVRALLHSDARITSDDSGFVVEIQNGRSLGEGQWANLLSPEHFDRDLLEGLRGSSLLRRYFRYTANTGLLVLRRAGGRTIKRSGGSWNSSMIFDRLYERDPNHPLVAETIRVVTHDLLDADVARAYVQAANKPIIVHPPAASPFSIGILTSSFVDAVTVDDRSALVEALYERVLQVMQASGEPTAAIA